MIKWDNAGLRKIDKALADALAKGAYVLQDEIREAQVVPRDIGTLQGEAFTVDTTEANKGYVRLSFDTPYARRLYYHPEYNFRKDENPNAQGMWMRHWLKGGKHEGRMAEIVAKILKGKV